MPGIPFYPEIEPFDHGMLAVDDDHRLYWEQCGEPNGVPVLFLHGGPGAGAGAVHRRFFDPKHYRIVIFDQRGAGRSEPNGELAHNTTPHLIDDIETLRRKFGIARWHVFGGSWGLHCHGNHITGNKACLKYRTESGQLPSHQKDYF